MGVEQALGIFCVPLPVIGQIPIQSISPAVRVATCTALPMLVANRSIMKQLFSTARGCFSWRRAQLDGPAPGGRRHAIHNIDCVAEVLRHVKCISVCGYGARSFAGQCDSLPLVRPRLT